MKLSHILISLGLFLLQSFQIFGQCPSGSLELLSQAEVDQFAIDYPNCNIINGHLTIGYATGIQETDITSLIPLSSIISVAGELTIRKNILLGSLNGLNHITSSANCTISNNNSLHSMEGLTALSLIDGNFVISMNDSLINLMGLDVLNQINDNFEISENPQLENLVGIESLTEVNGSFEFFSNNSLVDLTGLDNLSTIESYLSIQFNNDLTSLSGLNNILIIGGVLYLSENENLTSCEVEAVCSHLNNNSDAFIEANGPNCNSITEVTTACSTVDCQIDISSITIHTSCGENNGSILLSSVVGNDPFSFSWSNGDTTQSLDQVAAGEYQLTITDAINCTFIESYTIDTSSLLSYTKNLKNASCGENNGSIHLDDITGADPVNIEWSDGSTSDSLVNLAPGQYRLTLTDNNGCQRIDTFNIILLTIVNINIYATEETSEGAQDGSATVSPSEGQPPYSVLWSTGDTTFTVSDLTPGLIYVTVTDDDGCAVDGSINVPIFSCLNLKANTVLNPVSCIESCDGLIDLNVTGGTAPYSYSWENLPDTTAVLDGLCSGLYFYEITDVNNCTLAGGLTVLQPSPIVLTITSTNESYINQNDGTITIDTITGGTPPYTYLWSTGDTLSSILNLAPNYYFVSITDSNQCSIYDTIAINPGSCYALDLVDHIVHDGCISTCIGSISIDSVSNGEAPYTYKWSNGDTTNITDSLCFGQYTLTITDNSNCEYIKSYDIYAGDSSLTATDETYYESSQNANDGRINLSISGGTPPYYTIWNTGVPGPKLKNLGSGNYVYTIEDATGCSFSETVKIPIYDCNNFDIDIQSINTGCFGSKDGSSQLVSIDHLQSYDSLSWTTGSQDSLISNLSAGIYALAIKVDSNCTLIDTIWIEQDDEIMIIVDELVHLTDSTESSIEISTVGGKGDIMFSWTGPDNFTAVSSTISDLSEGCYHIIVTDSSGCSVQKDSICIEDLRVATEDISDKNNIILYPSPTRNTLNIVYSDLGPNTFMTVISIDGKKIIHKQRLKRTIDVSRLNNGLYILLIETESNKKYFKFNKT